MAKIALVGNPNCGKTTLFNTLTGLKQHVGNWPGKTVEKKEGAFEWKGEKFRIIDLPGTYSLNSYSIEEKITRDFLIEEVPDIVINIVDATNIERNLYVTAQLIELGMNVVVVLNMNGIARKNGIDIDVKKISELLGVPVVEVEAINGKGKEKLLEVIYHNKKKSVINDIGNVTNFTKERYKFIEKVIKESVRFKDKRKRITEKIDNIVTNKYLAIPIFLVIMYLIFYITFNVANPLVDIINRLFGIIGSYGGLLIEKSGGSDWMVSLFKDGIIGGVGSVIVFLPNILLLFFLITIMEDSGYMSRVAFIMDKLMSKIGLQGKSFIPLVLGFGCNVPAVLATRTLKNKKDRYLTMAMIPFMSCSARLPIYVLFVGALFQRFQGLVIFSIYLLGIIVAILTGIIFNKMVFRKDEITFIMELPSYRVPTLKNALIHTWDKGREFISKAGTLIFALVLMIWFMGNLPFGVEYASKESFIGVIGRFISPIFAPLGFGDWQSSVSLLLGIVAKEVVIGTLGALHGVGQEGLGLVIKNAFTPLKAYSFMVFTSLYVPCIATLSVIKRESNWKWVGIITVYVMAIAWIVAFIVYHAGMYLGGLL